jgi:ribosomal protein S18 acetylase RimI-like enzyme
MSIAIRPVSPNELEDLLPAFVELLSNTVNGGSSLGFLAPVSHEEGRDYWLSILPELRAGSRLLLAAHAEDRIVGSGQLKFPPSPNARHRAEIQKLFVAPTLRGRGVGRSLMAALHDTARQRGRSLLLLNTRVGEPAERFYKGLGYREVGVIPGYAHGSEGERYDSLTLYHDLSAVKLRATTGPRVRVRLADLARAELEFG